ncbi:MAG: hypothetical protein PHP44_10990 [Kiritimatiellae bacterium]|nr:hypothetical protein [Kiritimatiellia bacterium]
MGFAVGGLPGSADRLIGNIHSPLCLEENTECSRNTQKNRFLAIFFYFNPFSNRWNFFSLFFQSLELFQPVFPIVGKR